MRALLDLVFPAQCTGCGGPDGPVCGRCCGDLGNGATITRPTPCPSGLPSTYAVAPYEGSVRAMIVGYKDRDGVAVTSVLAAALRRALGAACAGLPLTVTPPLVVAVPSTRAAVRRRGYDPVQRLARAAGCRPLRGALTHVRQVRDSAGLSAAERAANLSGAFAVPAPMLDRVRGRTVVLVDDVVTTGATLAEAARALRSSGAVVPAAAVIAATIRRSSGG